MCTPTLKQQCLKHLLELYVFYGLGWRKPQIFVMARNVKLYFTNVMVNEDDIAQQRQVRGGRNLDNVASRSIRANI
jgi:hypothetical protein